MSKDNSMSLSSLPYNVAAGNVIQITHNTGYFPFYFNFQLFKNKTIVMSDLDAYMGLLILAGVYRSHGEAASNLLNADARRPIFHATMSLQMFHTILEVLRFDNCKTRPVWCVTDKMVAIRDVWGKNKWDGCLSCTALVLRS